ncbi:MAG: transporter substrate-binding protein [Cyanobacteria bacterium J06648_1]
MALKGDTKVAFFKQMQDAGLNPDKSPVTSVSVAEEKVRQIGSEYLQGHYASSGAIAGVAGALYTVQTGIIPPSIMQVAFSIKMVIWVAVGGRGTLIDAIIGTLLVRLAQTFLSERFPEIWLFFQGALFLIVVMVLPDGIVGWWTNYGWDKLRSLLEQKKIATYPSLARDPEVQESQSGKAIE